MIVLLASVFAIGVISGSLVIGQFFAGGVLSGGSRQSLSVEGFATITVFNPDGSVASVWKGHNAVYPYGLNAIAGCASGATSSPWPYGACSGWVKAIRLTLSTPSTVVQNATNTPTPVGCTPGGPTLLCSGWVSQATFGVSSFTYGNCGSSCTLTKVETYMSTTPFFLGFDYITTSVALVPGNSILVSINFTVS